jgi:Leucine-rich repeat (LRR) protein
MQLGNLQKLSIYSNKIRTVGAKTIAKHLVNLTKLYISIIC